VYVGRDDQAAVLACFDETATIVFGALCQLCAGDADLAVELLGDTYAYLARMAGSSYGVDVDKRWMLDATHSVYAARAPVGRNEIGPVAALAPRDRVIVHLHDVERRGQSEISLLLGVTIDDVEQSLAKGRTVIAPPESGSSTVDAFRVGDVWFDDTMRAEARARISGPTSLPEADDEHDTSSDDPAHALISRRTMVGAGATASIAALIGLGLWFGSSNGDEAAHGNELPEPPTTSTRPRATTPTTTPATEATDPATDETIVLGNDTTTTTSVYVARPTGYIVDPVPEALAPAGGYLAQNEENPVKGWFQLWASADAQHTAGRWLAMNAVDFAFRAPQPISPDTRRLDVGGYAAVVTTASTGIVNITTATTDGNRIELYSYGISIDQLGQVLSAMELTTNEEPVFGSAADAVLDGLDLRISRSAGFENMLGGVGNPDRGAFYSSPDGSQTINIFAGPQNEDDLFATTLLGTPSTDPTAIAYAPNGSIDIAGRHMLVAVAFETHLVQFHAGNDTITVSGNIPFSDLLDVASHTRKATEEEWQSQVNTIPTFSDDTDSGSSDKQPRFVLVTQSDSSADTGVVVRLGSERDTLGQWPIEIGTGTGTGSGTGTGTIQTSIEVEPARPVVVFIDIDVTIMVGVFESPGPKKKLRISLPGRPSVIVPLVPLGDAGAYGAAYAFSEIADFKVALVDTDGTVIQEIDV
jgi:hypothetical protein